MATKFDLLINKNQMPILECYLKEKYTKITDNFMRKIKWNKNFDRNIMPILQEVLCDDLVRLIKKYAIYKLNQLS